MPRLPFWGFSTATIAGAWYTGYHFIYEPRQAAQHGEEEQLTQSKLQYQDVIHAYARLRTRLEEHLGKSAAVASASSTSPQESRAAWFTNAEKIVFFCDMQLIRRLLWTVPHHLTTEKDLHRMFGDLAQWETQHCTELHFRDKPLLLTQTLRSLACFVVYVLVFRIADPLLSLWTGFATGLAQLRHGTAQFITKTLEIDAVMVTEDKPKRNGATHLQHHEVEEKGMEVGAAQNSAAVQYVTLSTSHWIEEVGFWACANNPLLTQGRLTEEPTLKHNRERATPSLLCAYSLPSHVSATNSLPWHRASWCMPFPSVSALTITYAQHWRQVAAAELAKETRGTALSSSPVSLLDVAATEVSLGYPLLTSATSLPSEGKDAPRVAARYIPVGVGGLPHLLYVDASHAVTDVRTRQTREEVYAQRQRAQYAHSASVVSKGSNAVHASAEPPLLSELQMWRVQGGPPWWRRVWWGGVFGGRRSSATAPSYTLRYYVGEPCTAAEYVTAAIEASRAVEGL